MALNYYFNLRNENFIAKNHCVVRLYLLKIDKLYETQLKSFFKLRVCNLLHFFTFRNSCQHTLEIR